MHFFQGKHHACGGRTRCRGKARRGAAGHDVPVPRGTVFKQFPRASAYRSADKHGRSFVAQRQPGKKSGVTVYYHTYERPQPLECDKPAQNPFRRGYAAARNHRLLLYEKRREHRKGGKPRYHERKIGEVVPHKPVNIARKPRKKIRAPFKKEYERAGKNPRNPA